MLSTGLVRFYAGGIVSAILILSVAGCGAAATPTVIPSPTPTSVLVSPSVPTTHGQELFVDKGCAACHGQNAEGSSIAPALPGHSDDQVRRQVRNPIGTMPRFSTDQISDQELEELIEFITGLESADGHLEPLDLAMADVVAMHHWMAILALKAGRVPEAKHHVSHIIDLLEDPNHRHRMEQVLEALDTGDLHEAEHTIEDMLAGVAEPELGLAELHLQMILSAIAVNDADDAQHHMGHYIEEPESLDAEGAQKAMEFLSAGELHEVEELVRELIEGMPHSHHHHN